MPDPDFSKIVQEARTHADADSLAAYLNRICGDDAELRRQIKAFLPRPGESGRLPEPDVTRVMESPADGVTLATGLQAPHSIPTVGLAAREFDPDMTTGSNTSQFSAREHGPVASLGAVIAGRYTLVELIGEGGMGTVYRASQTDPVKREVALKLIKSGMDSRRVQARFDAERQALAIMAN